MPRKTVGNPTFTAMVFGLVGGLVGAVAIGALAYTIPPPGVGGDPFFVAAARLLGLGTASWALGWILHLIVGMVIGAAFGVVVSRIPRFRTIGVGRKLFLGVGAGMVAWVVLFLPLALFVLPH